MNPLKMLVSAGGGAVLVALLRPYIGFPLSILAAVVWGGLVGWSRIGETQR